MRDKLRSFLMGRYGPDQLYIAMFVTAGVLGLVSAVTGFGPLYYVALVLLLLAAFRAWSRNIPARRRENDRFLTLWMPVKNKVTGWFRRLRDLPHYRFFRCPGCKNLLRVPRKKGKVQISCPRCGERFIRKT